MTDPVTAKIAECERAWQSLGASADDEAGDRSIAAFEDALRELLATKPTTPAGAVDMIGCYLSLQKDVLDEHAIALLETLRAFLRLEIAKAKARQ